MLLNLLNIRNYFIHFLDKISEGMLEVNFPDNRQYTFGDKLSKNIATMQIHDESLLKNLLIKGEIALGEGYINNLWESDNITQLLKLFITNFQSTGRLNPTLLGIFTLYDRIMHLSKHNTLNQAKINISEHYDLGNDFFSNFLDKTMGYSCGIFLSEKDTLEKAQNNKYQKLIKKTDIKSAERILEIGCGWGAFSIKLAQETNAKITAITISKQQYEYTKELINYHNLKNRIDLILEDYREINGKFDRIVAIEMLEAVGHEGLSVFFNKCNQLLNHNGSIVLQVITMPENRYDNYRKNVDFIQKYVFPGGHLPSLGAINEAASRLNTFSLYSLENIGSHYAKTLNLWNQNLQSNKKTLINLNYPEKLIKIWEYYFAYCEAAFESNFLDDLQLIYSR